MIATTEKLSTLAHAHKYWWKESYANGDGKIFFDDRGFDESVGGYVVGIVVPIKDDGEIIGVLKANINILGTFSTIVNHYNNAGQGRLKVVRTRGEVVYGQGNIPLSTRVSSEIIKKLENFETGGSLIEEAAKDYIVAYAPVRLSLDNEKAIFGSKAKASDSMQGNGGEIWHTVVMYEQEKALEQSKKANKIIIYTGLLAAIISALVAFFTGRWVSKPIEEL